MKAATAERLPKLEGEGILTLPIFQLLGETVKDIKIVDETHNEVGKSFTSEHHYEASGAWRKIVVYTESGRMIEIPSN